jgi:hypothetical protein
MESGGGGSRACRLVSTVAAQSWRAFITISRKCFDVETVDTKPTVDSGLGIEKSAQGSTQLAGKIAISAEFGKAQVLAIWVRTTQLEPIGEAGLVLVRQNRQKNRRHEIRRVRL